jgi:hypothetical protein
LRGVAAIESRQSLNSPRAPKLAAAHKKGQELGAQMVDAMDEWFTKGLTPYRELVLNNLRDGLQGYEHVEDIPPSYFVRSALADCYEALTARQPMVKTKTYEVLDEWVQVSDIMEMRAHFDQLVEKRLADFHADIRVEALCSMTESIPNLVEAEKQWRQQNPELSRTYPAVDDPNYKSDGRQVLPF